MVAPPPLGWSSDQMSLADDTSEARRTGGLRRLLTMLGIGGMALALIAVAPLAFSGGLRIRTPLTSMEAESTRFNLPEGLIVGQTTQTFGHHLCFLQCDDWRVEVRYTTAVGIAVDDLCDAIRKGVDDWGFEGADGDSFGERIPCRYRDRPKEPYCRAAYLLLGDETPEVVVAVSDCA